MKDKKYDGRGHNIRTYMEVVPASIGDKFGEWTLMSNKPTRTIAHGHSVMNVPVKCKCGFQRKVVWSSLYKGRTKMCRRCSGRIKIDVDTFERWGRPMDAVDRRLSSIWSSIKKRCYKKYCSNYSLYGGRGIKMSGEFKSVVVFANYCRNLPGYGPRMTLDRIDVNGNYCRGNLRWATQLEQSLNRRCTVYLTYQGEKIPARLFGIKYVLKFNPITVYKLALRGWTGEEILLHEASSKKAGMKYKPRAL